ncbi:MAG TPA: hypothetical protein PLQ79_05440 [Candidatus Cloacimonadota bacterium]|jgi:hypothetical protein|nr:hypothetical protein [Candidatus Cloacimonadota bacterium]HQP17998.1 hypothetical protein [Candidatus Cloacimonadota bacterium]
MYKYGISYYYMDGSIRKPRSGVDVRLLRPGQSWAEGIKLIEVTGGSGYYEISIESEAGCGYYELWDDLGSPFGQFSGKTCIIGRLDTRGLQNNSVNASHITDGSVTSSKIANGSLSKTHFAPDILTLSKLEHEIQDQNKGVGDNSQGSPANLFDDKTVIHVLEKEYQELPHIILSNQCDAFLYIIDAVLEGNMVTVTLGISQVYTASEPAYTLIAISK